jgi:hypothetical protein
MTTLKTKTIDTSTICPGKGGSTLPVVAPGTTVMVKFQDHQVKFSSGFSSEYQLCAAKGTGLELHNMLVEAGAARNNPVEVEISYETAEE